MNINLNISLFQVFGVIVGVCLMVAYFVGDTHPEVRAMGVPMVDPNISHHHPDDIPVLDEDGL